MFKSLLAESAHFDTESVVVRYPLSHDPYSERAVGDSPPTFSKVYFGYVWSCPYFLHGLASYRSRLSSFGSGMQSDQESSLAVGVFRNWLDVCSTLESKFEAST